ncbi:MAG: amino acid adenylation domain-containing protein, partial [Verrucomicrobia bacterium]
PASARTSMESTPGAAGATPGLFRMVALHDNLPQSTAYNEVYAWRLQGAFDPDRMARAWDDVVARHEMLRARIVDNPGGPDLLFVRLPPTRIEVEPHEFLPDGLRDGEGARAAREESGKRFDLRTAPLWRWRCLRFDADDHVVVLAIHHVLIDDWSRRVLLRDLVYRYDAGDGPPQTWPWPAGGPGDFARWQAEQVSGETQSRLREFWRGRFADPPRPVTLPCPARRHSERSGKGYSLFASVAPRVREAIARLAREESASNFAAAFAAFQIVLNRLGGDTDLVVGTPASLRRDAETKNAVGLILNTLPVRVRVDPAASFRAAIRANWDATRAALAHVVLPIDDIFELASSPTPGWLNVLFVMVEEPDPGFAPAGTRSRRLEIDRGTAKFDFLFFLRDDGLGGWRAEFEFDADRFDPGSAARMVARTGRILGFLAEHPDDPVASTAFPDPGEPASIRQDFLPANSPPEFDADLWTLVARAAGENPSGPAVMGSERTILHSELLAESAALAASLRRRGAGIGTRVGILLERSEAFVVAVLGILRSGAACVPLDPSLPVARLRTLVADAEPAVVVTRPELRARAGLAPGICLDFGTPDPGVDPASLPPAASAPTDVVYVIYTSGSTGTPKGVCQTQRALANLVRWQRSESGDQRGRVTPLFAGLGFDVCFQELFSTLAAGGTLWIPAESDRKDPALMARMLAERSVARWFLPTALLPVFCEGWLGMRTPLPSLGEIIVAGEALRITEPVARFFGENPGIRLVNHYGPTETHVATAWHAKGPAAAWPVLPPIGQPIANTRAHVLDPDRRPVPAGIPGELWIAGAAVGAGYFRRPELTAARFLPDAFGPDPDARMYATGDRVRRQEDGTLEFLGRLDLQIKVRGFRVEPGEIEAALRGHPGITDAVVRLQPRHGADPVLVVYWVGTPDGAGDDTPRARLGQSLPAYMVPDVFVRLERLPVGPNGKVDRDALPDPDRIRPRGPGAATPARTPTERLVAGIWEECLKRTGIGAEEDFQALGGHSLTAMRIAARLGKALGRPIAMRVLHKHRTIAQLARHLDGDDAGTGERSGIPAAVADPVPSYSQARMLFLEAYEAAGGLYHVPVVLRLRGPLDVGRLRAALGEITRRHAVLRSAFPDPGGVHRVEIKPPGPVDVPVTEMPDLPSGSRDERIRDAIASEIRRRFDLRTGPPVRFRLLRSAPDEHWFVAVFHHAVIDGWSVDLFLRELAAIHDAMASGKEPVVPELTLQFHDHARDQRDRLRGETLLRSVEYWRRELAGIPALLDLPLDRPRAALRSHRGAAEARALEPGLTIPLQRLAAEHGVTRFILLLAAFQTLLHRYAGQEQVVVGTPIAGRGESRIEPLIGFFANTLPLRGDFSGNPTFVTLLGRVRTAVFGALDHQELPFERLVEELRLPRDPAHSPVFQAMFSFENETPEAIPFGGLDVALVDSGTETSKFDLSLVVTQRGDGLHATLSYAADLFDASTVRGFLDSWETLLRGIVDAPDQPVGILPLAGASIRRQVTVDWNQTDMELPPGTLPRWIAETARRHPDRVAAAGAGTSLTYGELDARADALARRLRQSGIGPDDRVAVCAGRTPRLVVALLGILRSGGAKVLLSERSLAHVLPANAPATLHLDDIDWSRAPGVPPVADTTSPSDLAYVIYTSGSSGTPKGVAVEHRNLAAFVGWALRNHSPAELSSVLFSTSVCFDISVLEVFATLAAGGTVHVARDPFALEALPDNAGITLLDMVPSVFREVLRLGLVPRSVRTIVLGGEAVPQDLVALAYGLGHVQRVLDQYGPTETTVYSTSALRGIGQPATIGRPIANTRIYVVDPALRPVPPGVAGEILIGGAGVSRGYLGLPELTADKFLPDPFRPGSRVYRTGDLARWRNDGTLVFLGRNDAQIKVRGFRIEPGEIEAELVRQPTVAAAVVVPAEILAGEPVLVAYVVARDGANPDPKTLLASLRTRLPDHLVPRRYIVVDQLPRTPGGKIDRARLPAPRPESTPDGPGTVRVPPSTPTERVVARVWSGLIAGIQPAADDHFFDLGGHSLLAMRLVAQLNDELAMRLPLHIVFLHPVLGKLAARIDALRWASGGAAAPESMGPDAGTADRDAGEL